MLSNIQDLDYLETFSNCQPIVGGAYTYVSAEVSTSFGLATSGVTAIALGDKTSTFANASTKQTQTSFSTNSYARADGKAFAQTGNQTSKTTVTKISYSGYVGYFHR
jgi:uncharacterized Zn-binding protein involved in type VI secretion